MLRFAVVAACFLALAVSSPVEAHGRHHRHHEVQQSHHFSSQLEELESVESELSVRIHELQKERREVREFIGELRAETAEIAEIDESYEVAQSDDAEYAEATAGEIISKVQAFLTKVGQAHVVLPATLTTIVGAITSVPGLSTAFGALLTAAGAGPAGAPIAHYTIAIIQALNSAAVANGGKLTVKDAAKAIGHVALTGGVGQIPAVKALVTALKFIR